MAPSTQPALQEALRKFPLHPTAFTAAGSPIVSAIQSTAPLPSTALSALRASLLSARTLAAERTTIRDANRRNIAERQSSQARALEESAKAKEQERRRKREEDDKRERERLERAERDREEQQRQQGVKEAREEESYHEAKAREERDRQQADERERLKLVKQAVEAKHDREEKDAHAAGDVREKDKLVQVLDSVRNNDDPSPLTSAASTATTTSASTPSHLPSNPPLPPSAQNKDGDITMDHAAATSIPLSAAPTHLAHPVETIQPAPLSRQDSDRPPTITISDDGMDDDQDGLIHMKHTDKKRKRILDSDNSDVDDDDDQPMSQKFRKLEGKATSVDPSTAPPSVPGSRPTSQPPGANSAAPERDHLTLFQRMLKEEKYIKHSIPTKPPAAGTAQAFYLPSGSLAPPKPNSIPATPTPKKQSEVSEDFSKAKAGTQITHNAFHTWADAYLRPFGEDDLAFLAPSPEDMAPYIIPPLGPHYVDRWEADDADPPIPLSSLPITSLDPPRLPRFRPEALTEDALGMEGVFLGPLSERLVAAMVFEEGQADEDEEAWEVEEKVFREAEDENAGQVVKGQVLDAVELEERVKRELKFIGVLPEEDVDWSAREDDEVSSALRACQRLLQRQTVTNEARKAILSSIVKDRMAYQDYETTRDAQERVVEAGWTKRYKAGKKKGKGRERDRDKNATAEPPKPPPVSLALLSAVHKRDKLVSMFQPFFDEEEDVGRFFGIPEKSIYEGLLAEGIDDADGEIA